MIDIGLAQRLPDPARRKLRLLNGLAMSADAVAEAAARQLNKLDGDDPNVERLQRTVEEQEHRRAQLFELVGSCTRWLRANDSAEFEVVEAAAPPRAEGESAERVLGRVRAQINALIAERERVRRARLPKAAIKAAIRDQVLRLADHGRPMLRPDHRGVVEPVFGDPRGGVDVDVRWVVGLVCWAVGGQVIERLDEMVDGLTDEGMALAASERESELARIEVDLDQLERSEEALISQVYEANVDFLRRAQASPSAVLAVRVVRREERPARRPRPAPTAQAEQAAE